MYSPTLLGPAFPLPGFSNCRMQILRDLARNQGGGLSADFRSLFIYDRVHHETNSSPYARRPFIYPRDVLTGQNTLFYRRREEEPCPFTRRKKWAVYNVFAGINCRQVENQSRKSGLLIQATASTLLRTSCVFVRRRWNTSTSIFNRESKQAIKCLKTACTNVFANTSYPNRYLWLALTVVAYNEKICFMFSLVRTLRYFSCSFFI